VKELQPIRGRVLVKQLDEPSRGPLLAVSSPKKVVQGTVVAVDPLEKYKDLQVGQLVVYEKGKATPVKIGSTTFFLITEENILGVADKWL
jgi:co-chaperonin GroES (HSP10)